MSKLIHLVCDYGPGDLAWSEIVSALVDQGMDGVTAWPTAANSFDTVSTGFTVAQLAARRFKNPGNVYIFANCAPRKDAARPRTNNEGEGLLYAVLENGVRVLAVNSGYSLSFLRPYIKELWSTNAQEGGSQFRSRDFFPIAIAQLLMRDDLSFLKNRLTVEDVVPEYPRSVVGYVDSFGNMKTTIKQGDNVLDGLKPGDVVKVKIGTVTLFGTVAGGSFGVGEGELAFAPGSSGHDGAFWELFKRGGSAYEAFDKPAPGSTIFVERASRAPRRRPRRTAS